MRLLRATGSLTSGLVLTGHLACAVEDRAEIAAIVRGKCCETTNDVTKRTHGGFGGRILIRVVGYKSWDRRWLQNRARRRAKRTQKATVWGVVPERQLMGAGSRDAFAGQRFFGIWKMAFCERPRAGRSWIPLVT